MAIQCQQHCDLRTTQAGTLHCTGREAHYKGVDDLLDNFPIRQPRCQSQRENGYKLTLEIGKEIYR